jgi:hypothetical protein
MVGVTWKLPKGQRHIKTATPASLARRLNTSQCSSHCKIVLAFLIAVPIHSSTLNSSERLLSSEGFANHPASCFLSLAAPATPSLSTPGTLWVSASAAPNVLLARTDLPTSLIHADILSATNIICITPTTSQSAAPSVSRLVLSSAIFSLDNLFTFVRCALVASSSCTRVYRHSRLNDLHLSHCAPAFYPNSTFPFFRLRTPTLLRLRTPSSFNFILPSSSTFTFPSSISFALPFSTLTLCLHYDSTSTR